MNEDVNVDVVVEDEELHVDVENDMYACTGDMKKSTYDSNYNGIVDNAEKVNNHTVESDVPQNAVFTDTVYDDTQVKSDINNLQTNKADKSEIPDVSNFITKAVNDLVNYYKKSETYTQAEVNQLVSAIPKFAIEVVNTLPVSEISNTTIYLLTSGAETQNLYTEYIYVNNTWEKLGTQTVDLTNYYTKTQVDTLLENVGGNEIYVGDEQDAPNTAKLIIDSPEIANYGSEIESGNNNTAYYIKFKDGTLIQYGTILINLTDSRNAGGLTYYSGAEDVTLPENFKDTNYAVTTSVMIANMNYFSNAYAAVVSKDKINVSLINTDINDSRYVSFVCIGRWK